METHINGRTKEIFPTDKRDYIIEKILSVLSEQKVSLSEARGAFEYVLCKIEDESIISQ